MKPRLFLLTALASLGIPLFSSAQTTSSGLTMKADEIQTLLDLTAPTTPEARKFYFETIPGHRYSLWKSTNLSNWQEVDGFPKVADGLSMEHTFPQQTSEFFRVEPIDEQAPVIVS